MDNVKAFVAILTKVEDRLENIHSIIKRIERLATIINYSFGGWTEALGFLCLLVIVDYVTGVAAAIKTGTGLNSNTGFWGICKKSLMFAVIAILHRADILIGTDVLMIGAVYFYIANELVSIIENLGKLNFPLPPQFKQIVDVLKNKRV